MLSNSLIFSASFSRIAWVIELSGVSMSSGMISSGSAAGDLPGDAGRLDRGVGVGFGGANVEQDR
jgi:hypothetical protein